MINIELPFLDHTGKLSAPVLEALANGAVSSNHPTNPDRFIMTFDNEADADAFEARIAPEAPTE